MQHPINHPAGAQYTHTLTIIISSSSMALTRRTTATCTVCKYLGNNNLEPAHRLYGGYSSSTPLGTTSPPLPSAASSVTRSGTATVTGRQSMTAVITATKCTCRCPRLQQPHHAQTISFITLTAREMLSIIQRHPRHCWRWRTT